MTAERTIVALHGEDIPAVSLEPAPRWRPWMEATVRRNANRCLPLLMANESGWVMRNPVPFTATWDGSDLPAGVRIEIDAGAPHHPGFIEPGFGHGIVTFAVPYLFRTPPGFNLLARGPAHWPKDGASPLEGLVETDWSVATFTMNWKLTRPEHPVRFELDEPFCMVVPQRRGELESFAPAVRPFRSDPETLRATKQWNENRHQLRVHKFLAQHSKELEGFKDHWERTYFKGKLPDGSDAPEHQTKLRLKPFDGDGTEAS